MIARPGRVSMLELTNAVDFTVNNAVNFVTASVAGNPSWIDAGGNQTFPAGENIILQKVWVSSQYQFGLKDASIGFNIQRNLANIPELIGAQLFPNNVCNPVELDIYIPAPDLVTAYTLDLGNDPLQIDVSMINVPSSLNGLTMSLQILLQVYHTRALSP